MSTMTALHALTRFGLGPAPGEVKLIAGHEREWLRGQVRSDWSLPVELRPYRDADAILRDMIEHRRQRRNGEPSSVARANREQFRREMADRILAMARSSDPLAERLVAFWSNHFTVSSSKALIGPALGAFEREAIRPHVFGRFEDMLLAVCRHPCMTIYLDNHVSVGPNSRIGKRAGRQLNENLAREVLELHTLGVNGGYVQDDVVELARALTGWSHSGAGRADQAGARFLFKPAMHEPGSRLLLGRRYPEAGVEQGEAILRDLARHRASARFVATKLVRHFVSDEPPAGAVEHLARIWLDSGADLGVLTRALIDLPAAWQQPLAKVRTPFELVVATYRATADKPTRPLRLVDSLRQMGQPPFGAPSPAGWPDTARQWISPEALLRRIEWVRAAAGTFERTLQPMQVLAQSLGDLASEATRHWVAAAPSTDAALAMIFASREFQRR